MNSSLSILRKYYVESKNNPSVVAFAFQLYSIAEYWYLCQSLSSPFIDEAFRRAAADVLTNPRYSPAIYRPQLFALTRSSLAALGIQHLHDHIAPCFQYFLQQGTEEKLTRGISFQKAFSETAEQLRSEHERFLTLAIPYGVEQLVKEGLISGSYGTIYAIQGNARGMRFQIAGKVLEDFVARKMISERDALSLSHSAD